MADIRANFIAGRMNKSVDERLIPQGEYVDAVNVRLGSTETTEIGAVENSKGNSQLTFLQYQGTPLGLTTTSCVGVYEDGMQETIYWFVHDSNNPLSPTNKIDMIVSFNTNTNLVTYHVISISGVLNFDPKYLITGVNKIDDLLFFTDNLNPPRYINVTRNYPDPVAGVDGVESQDLNVIVKPPGFEDPTPTNTPLPVPKVTPITVPGDANYMQTRFLCFAYRYRYTDGGYSATSLFSMPAFQPGAFRFSLDKYDNQGMLNRYNGALVEFSTGSKRVVQVDLLYKQSGSNVIYVIEKYNKKDLAWPDNSTQNLTFSNSKIFTTLGSDELLRQYDNVPRIAKAQTIQGNRLIYANYVDGYDIVNQNKNSIPIDYRTDHIVEAIGGIELPAPTGSTGDTYTIKAGTSIAVQNSKLTFDLSPLELPIKPGVTMVFSVAIQSAPTTDTAGGVNPIVSGSDVDASYNQPTFTLSWTFTAATTYASVSDLVNSVPFTEAIGQAYPPSQPIIPFNLSGNGGTATDRFNNTIAAIIPGTASCALINTSITSSCSTAAPPASASCTPQGFRVTTSSTGFSIQVPAARYYSEDDPADPGQQLEYFNFIPFDSEVGYLLTADTYSLHSNRDYETGVVYMDDYGRASTVLVSNENTIYVPPINSIDKNTCKVTLNNPPPYWATKYKFVMKPSQGDYFSVYSSLYFEDCQDVSLYWFKLEGDNTNIVKTGMNLILKKDTQGAASREIICKVLDVRGFPAGGVAPDGTTDLLCIDGTGADIVPGGVYMCIKPGNFSTDTGDDTILNFGFVKDESNDKHNCKPNVSYSLNYPSTSTNTGPYDLPAGSSVRVQIINWRGSYGNNCSSRRYELDSTYGASQDYPDFWLWWKGEQHDFTNGYKKSMNAIQYPGTLFSSATAGPGSGCWTSKFYCYGDNTPVTGNLKFFNWAGIKRCGPGYDKRPAHCETRLEVLRGGEMIAWETEPNEADPNLFYDASEMMDIYTDPSSSIRYHKAGSGPNDVDQSASNPLETTLKFANCFTFGNGIESFRITDSPDGRSFDLGERVLAVSNQEFKEAHRFAGLTYSGVFSGAANNNNLNEFNLGLVNYKDAETGFGPIELLHSRETDILTLQEDRISYILASKNVITDSTGGGAIASVPQVLGTQIARIEEYGISFNPESFAAWGSDMFFTDAKRGAVINLRGTSRNTDQIKVISHSGMRSWFRDQFAAQLQTQKLGGFDPYMNEYVLSTNNTAIPLPSQGTPCGTTLTQANAVNNLSYSVNVGDAIGDITIPFTITSGQITVTATWNGTAVSVGPTDTNGSITVNKTSNAPTAIDILVVPNINSANPSADYGITVNCPPQDELTIVRIVLTSPNNTGEFIHFAYKYNFGAYVSPQITQQASFGTSTPTEYISQVGVRSIGAFPNTGATITMKTIKQGFDDFVFNSAEDKFKWLSSNTLYNNTAADMTSLLSNPSLADMTPISNPSTGVFEASVTTTSGNFPANRQYLYLVWDLREIGNSELCYDPSSAEAACCLCTPTCKTTWFGPMRNTIGSVCTTNTNTQGASFNSFHGNGTNIPLVGDIAYIGSSCSPITNYVLPGYYIVDPNQPSAAQPKNWIEIGVNGAVIDSGKC
tara:strand:- start:25093 stop:29937 length:4845 start_codon:yes stop_codon:yes gene_type:complete